MSRLVFVLGVVALVGASLASAEEPPYKRLLQGDDAKKAAALEKQVYNLWAAGTFQQAVAPAEQLLVLRKRVQGDKHWETEDVARLVRTLRQVAALPADRQVYLAKAPSMAVKATALHRRGKYAEAESLFRHVLTLYEEVLGPAHPDTAQIRNNLATNLDAQGCSREAEPLHRKALAVWEEVLGPQHPDTAASCHNLALNLDAQWRWKEAEPLYRKALAIKEEVLGPQHPTTVASCDNLALNLDAQGRFKEAEVLHRKALAAYEGTLGPKHPNTSPSYVNLGRNLDDQGRLKEAETMYRKALALNEEVLGTKHPETATSYNNLAANLNGQSRFDEAETLHRKALAIRQEVLGLKHPHTASSYGNLALCLDAQGRYMEAEVLHRNALAVCEEVLGPRHRYSAASYANLALCLDARGRRMEAEPLHRKALAVCEEVLGPQHPDTAASCHNLALNLDGQGRSKEAEVLYRKALAVYEEVLGPKHPATAGSYNSLAGNLQVQGRFKEAESLFRKALAIWERVLGPQHSRTANCNHNLASNLNSQGRTAEAESLYRKALAVCEVVLGPNHPDTAFGYSDLAANLEAQDRVKEAEPLCRKALAIREKVLGPKHLHTAGSYNNLAAILQIQGRFREAESFWQAGADAKEAARLRLAGFALDKATAARLDPHLGLATCRARLGRRIDAWNAAEAGLARGVLDDLANASSLSPDPGHDRRARVRANRLDALNKVLTPLLVAQKLDEDERRRRDELLKERVALEDATARESADSAGQTVLSLAQVQEQLAPETAFVFWVNWSQLNDHWACVLRRSGPPAWVRLTGSGTEGTWTEDDDKLPELLRDDLSRGEPGFGERARSLAAQRLDPLAPYLAATADLPTVRHIVAAPILDMAAIPLEVLTDRYLVSYAPSGSVFARLRDKHRPLDSPTLLALGDPNFNLPDAGPPPEPPEQGLYLALVLPGSNAARAGLRSGDVLLRYGDTKLISKTDLQLKEEGEPIPVSVWRDGKTLDSLRIAPGKLGIVLSDDPPAAALRRRRERELLADARSRDGLQALPGTRLEVGAIAGLLPEGKSTLLLGSKASEQELDTLAAAGKLRGYRLLLLATHGAIDPTSAAHSWLALARDRLPDPEQQARLAAAGKKVPTGRLFVGDMAEWDLDADLVTLSACRTGLGRDGGGEGLLGFSQVLLGRGARSVLLSLWKVDDTATALLMMRFYQNLLGKREGLKATLPKAEALREAKQWLRTLPRADAEALAGKLARGTVRLAEEDKTPVPMAVVPEASKGEAPFAHPRYWAAFILIGDPE